MKREQIWRGVLVFACFLCALLTVTGIVLASGERDMRAANASVHTDSIVSEQFYSDALDDDWLFSGTKFNHEDDVLHFTNSYSYGSAIILTAAQLGNYATIKFDFQIETFENNSFIDLYLGGESESDSVTGYSTQIALRSQSITVAQNDGNKNYNQKRSTIYLRTESGSIIDSFAYNGGLSTVEITVENQQGDLYDITVVYTAEDNEYFRTTFSGYEIAGGYIGFDNASNIVWNMMNFSISDGNAVLFSDRFEEDTVTEPLESPSGGNWHLTGNFSKDNIYVGRIANLLSDSANACSISRHAISNHKQSYTENHLTLSMCIDDFEGNVLIGAVFGLEQVDSNPADGAWIGLRRKDESYAEFVYVVSGQVMQAGETIPLSELGIGENRYLTAEWECRYNGTVCLRIGSYEEAFTEVDYAGFWGIGQLALSIDEAVEVKFDDVYLENNTLVNYSSPDVSNNFGGIKEEDGFEDYYVNRQKYYFGPRVELAQKGIFVSEPYVQFTNSTPYSCFGYREKYDEFILEFDYVTTNAVTYQVFGISFGKNVIGTMLSGEYDPAVGFIYTNGGTSLKTYGCQTEEGRTEVPQNGYNFFADTSTRYNFMFVVRDRSVEVYYKKDSDPVSELGILRAKIVDVNTDGYVTIFGSASASFQIYDFKLTNLNETCSQSSMLALRENFEDETLSDGLVLEGGHSWQNGAVVLSDGAALSMQQQDTFYLVRFNAFLGNGLTIQFSGDRKIIFLPEEGIFAEDGDVRTQLSLLREIDMLQPSTVEVRIQGTMVTIGWRGEGEVDEMLYRPLCSAAFETQLEEGTLSFISQGDCALSELAIFSLSDLYEAQATDYIGNEDNASAWIEKELAPSEPEQDIPWWVWLLVGLSCAVVVVGVTVVFILYRRKT